MQDSQRRAARRTVLWLALLALAFYLGFFALMGWR